MILLLGMGCFSGANSAASAEYVRQVSTANLRAAQLEAQLVDATQRLGQVEAYVRQQGQTEAAKLENLDQVNVEVTRLRGEIEVLKHGLETLQTELSTYQVGQERRQLHDESRLRQIEEFLAIKPPPPPTEADMGLAPGTLDPEAPLDPEKNGTTGVIHDPAAPPVDAPADAKGKIELAKQHMDAGRPSVARAVLTPALEQHASDPEAAEIAYRYAQTWMAEQNYRKAALAFKKVTDNHPKSAWAAWAMLRQGECFEGLGQGDNARLFFDGVIQRYPKSDAAKEAKKRLGQ